MPKAVKKQPPCPPSPPYNLRSKKRKTERWEEVKCPICQDHPHKAVLLICSSHDKGCRPYMCDTGDSLSNCFVQFCELNTMKPSESKSELADYQNPNQFVRCGEIRRRKFACPHCRGKLKGWVLVKRARDFMDKIARSCAMDSCEFSGNYAELKKHAKTEHPTARASRVLGSNKDDEDDEYDEYDIDELEYYSEFDDEDFDGGEGTGVSLRPGDDFSNHIHFGSRDEILKEDYYVSNGVEYYTRTTTTGITYEYCGRLGEEIRVSSILNSFVVVSVFALFLLPRCHKISI